MKPLNILFPVLITFFSCSKHYEDYSYWNTDRRPQIILVSERFTDPPKWLNNKEWKPDSIVYHYLDRGVDTMAYSGRKPDTTKSTCPIFGDNLYIEISYYKIKTFKR